MRVQFKRSEVPVRRTRDSMWDRMIPEALIREMRLNPGVTFQLLDEHGDALEVVHADYAALLRGVHRPFRVQSRASNKALAGKAYRHVWVSFDPGYWEKHAGKRKRGGATR